MRRALVLGTATALLTGFVPAGADPAPAVPPSWPFPLAAQPVAGKRGMVACDAPIAAKIGRHVLELGGNAVDAAVATAFAMAVVLPRAGNIGGGGFLVAHLADGRNVALDFRETAPAAATRDMFLDAAGEMTDRSLDGCLAAGVPGTVAGLWEAHREYGSKPWAELIAPAIRLAEAGFLVDSAFAASVGLHAERLARFHGARVLFLPGGRPLERGTRWRNAELAVVLQRIADQGPDGFYRGPTADRIAQMMEGCGGIVTREDLAAYSPRWREPIVIDYAGHGIVTMPPPSSGGIAIALIAHLLRRTPLGAEAWGSADRVHLLAEASRRAFAVRNTRLGDPDFLDIPLARLLSEEFAESLSGSITRTRATPSAELFPEAAPLPEGRQTTHLSVTDRFGAAVSLTTTLNTSYGSAVVVDGCGFLLNNEMDDFTTKPGSRNFYGLVQGEANAIVPGKRMLSSMAPTIVCDAAGEVVLVTGASGGPTIISTVFQILSNVLDHRMDIAAAVSAPRVHMQHLPDSLYYDAGGLEEAVIDTLRRRGHAMAARPIGGIGVAPSILRRDGAWRGMADPRVPGLAAGD